MDLAFSKLVLANPTSALRFNEFDNHNESHDFSLD